MEADSEPTSPLTPSPVREGWAEGLVSIIP